MKKRAKAIISHRKIVEVTRPAYILGIIAGVITLIVALFLLVRIPYTEQITNEFSFLKFGLLINFLVAILMFFSAYLLRKEHHCFGGSVMLLCSSIIGLSVAAGLIIGPLFGILGGILGMSEHEKLIKHHLD